MKTLNGDFGYDHHIENSPMGFTVERSGELPYPPSLEILSDYGKDMVEVISSGIMTVDFLNELVNAGKSDSEAFLKANAMKVFGIYSKIANIKSKLKTPYSINLIAKVTNMQLNPSSRTFEKIPNFDYRFTDEYWAGRAVVKYFNELDGYKNHLARMNENNILMAQVTEAREQAVVLTEQIKQAILKAKVDQGMSGLGELPVKPSVSGFTPQTLRILTWWYEGRFDTQAMKVFIDVASRNTSGPNASIWLATVNPQYGDIKNEIILRTTKMKLNLDLPKNSDVSNLFEELFKNRFTSVWFNALTSAVTYIGKLEAYRQELSASLPEMVNDKEIMDAKAETQRLKLELIKIQQEGLISNEVKTLVSQREAEEVAKRQAELAKIESELIAKRNAEIAQQKAEAEALAKMKADAQAKLKTAVIEPDFSPIEQEPQQVPQTKPKKKINGKTVGIIGAIVAGAYFMSQG